MCPIFFDIYGMKLNDGHFPSGTVIIYSQKSFKWRSTLSMRLNAVRFAHVPFDFIPFYFFMLAFEAKLKDANK